MLYECVFATLAYRRDSLGPGSDPRTVCCCAPASGVWPWCVFVQGRSGINVCYLPLCDGSRVKAFWGRAGVCTWLVV